jgi:hypothetical protein
VREVPTQPKSTGLVAEVTVYWGTSVTVYLPMGSSEEEGCSEGSDSENENTTSDSGSETESNSGSSESADGSSSDNSDSADGNESATGNLVTKGRRCGDADANGKGDEDDTEV